MVMKKFIWYTRGIVYVWKEESNLEGSPNSGSLIKERDELFTCKRGFPTWVRSPKLC